MLPFLQPKKMSSVIVAKTKDGGGLEAPVEADETDPVLMNIAEGLISAIHSKDATAVAECLKEAFAMFDSEPHVEGEHV